MYTSPVTTTGTSIPLSPQDDPRVGWIHELQRHQLVAEMNRHGLLAEGSVAELRRQFCVYWRNIQIPTAYGDSVTQRLHPDDVVCEPRDQMALGDATGQLLDYGAPTAAVHRPPAIVVTPASTDSGHRAVLEEQPYRAPRSSTMTLSLPRDYASVQPLVQGFNRVREMLGLSPNADMGTVERTLAEVLNPGHRTAATDGVDFGRLSMPATSHYAAPSRGYEAYGGVTTARQPQQSTHHGEAYANDGRSLDNFEQASTRAPAVETSHYAAPPRVTDTYGGAPSSHLPRRVVHSEEPRWNVDKTSSTLCDRVRKWNLRFDGRRDAVSFLERLEELREAYALSPEEVLKAMPELLQGQALLWFRNNRDFWTSFSDFRRAFEANFFPPGYYRHLDEEIRRRTQGESESFRDFVISLTTLIRRSGRYSNQEKLDLVYLNMRPEYKFMIRRLDFCSLPDLIERAEEYEELLRERKNFRPPPPATQALVAETAYVPRRRADRAFDVAATECSMPANSMTRKTRTGDSPRGRDNQARRVNTSEGASGRNQNKARQGQRSSDPRNEPGPSTSSPKSNRTPIICWNCNVEGHYFKHCDQPKVLRCFRCKREGVRTTRCNCQSGNSNRTQASGGRLSPRSVDVQPPRSGRSGSNA